MIQPISTLISATDSAGLGRLNYESMSQQALMEMVFSGIKNQEIFQDEHGNFLEVCEWPGVDCNADGEVEQINFDSTGGGPLPEGTAHLEFIPNTANTIRLDRTALHGTVDFGILPPKLENFFIFGNKFRGEFRSFDGFSCLGTLVISGNNFHGSVDASALPRTLMGLSIDSNDLHGSLELEKLPRELEWLRASRNKLEGTLDFSSLPERLKNLFLGENKFHGSVDLTHLPGSLEKISIYKNLFTGEIDTIRLPKSLQLLGAGSNALSGNFDTGALPPNLA